MNFLLAQTDTTTTGGAEVLVLLIILAGAGTIGALIMDRKGRAWPGGFALGFFLGIIGIVIAAVWPRKQGRVVSSRDGYNRSLDDGFNDSNLSPQQRGELNRQRNPNTEW